MVFRKKLFYGFSVFNILIFIILFSALVAFVFKGIKPEDNIPAMQTSPPPLQMEILLDASKPLLDSDNPIAASIGEETFAVSSYVVTEVDSFEAIEIIKNNSVAYVEITAPPSINDSIDITPHNLDARITHKVEHFLATFEAFTEHGANETVAVFDGGKIRASHQEFQNDTGDSRVTIHASVTESLSDHSTHVAGTIGAKGVEKQAEGMAKNTTIISFDWNEDLNNLAVIDANISVSNHSYGPISGWYRNDFYGWVWYGDTSVSEIEDSKFGKYAIKNHVMDNILYNNKYLLSVIAAGNDRGEGPANQPTSHFAITKDPVTGKKRFMKTYKTRPLDGGKQGYDTISGLGVSKNVLTIGAIYDIKNASDPIKVTNFSAFGPTDDYRIKPDLVANGQYLYSTSSKSDDAYVEMPGTSMASPTAAGIATLLFEMFEKVYQRRATAAEIKAIMIHSATDAGEPGPDLKYGWGAINAFAAGKIIKNKNSNVIIYDAVVKNKSYSRQFTLSNDTARITLVWTDPAGKVNQGEVDDSVSTLVNDLDLMVTDENGNSFWPYQLDSATFKAINNGPNHVDNVEVIDLPSNMQGKNITVTVNGKGITKNNKQNFALVISEVKPIIPPSLQVEVLLDTGKPLLNINNPVITSKSYEGKIQIPYMLADANSPEINELVENDVVIAQVITAPPSFDDLIDIAPSNINARITHKVNVFLTTFEAFTEHGASETIAIFDSGKVRASHQEFQNNAGDSRITIHNSVTEKLNDHATHIAGTIGAKGIKEKALGMAKNALIISLDWHNDIDNLTTIDPNISVSNHSYSPKSGWYHNPRYGWLWYGNTSLSEVEDSKFGKYGIKNRVMDDVLYKNKYLLSVIAAGNDRNPNSNPFSQPVEHFAVVKNPTTGKLEFARSSKNRPIDGGQEGYDTISGLGVSKNVLTIGAIYDIRSASDTINVTDFSAFGPTDDYRIKPDLVANGQYLYSTSSEADDAYIENSGTSMASPTAAGIAALLFEMFKKVYQHRATAAEIKAIMIHTATDSGEPGPDPKYGWGAINAFAAGSIIADKEKNTIVYEKITENTDYLNQFILSQDNNRITLVWTDPAGIENDNGVDDSTPTLVNNLDLSVIDEDGNIFWPYQLDPTTLKAVNNGPNNVDNVEVIDLPAGMKGKKITIKITSSGTIKNIEQSFALVVSGTIVSQSQSIFASAKKPKKLAIVVGINDFLYLNNLKGAINDAYDMKNYLENQGFIVKTLINEQATYENILVTLKEMLNALDKADKEDAIVVFHVSSHGGQIKDISGDELDGLDEVIATYDSNVDSGINDITDDQIYGFTNQLESYVNHMVLIYDTCHSGLAAKGQLGVRSHWQKSLLTRDAGRETRIFAVNPPKDIKDDLSDNRPYVLISGCHDFENCYEISTTESHIPRGALTYHLLNYWRTSYNATYLSTLEQIIPKIQKDAPQTPQIEGTFLNQQIFSIEKNLIPSSPYILAHWQDKHHFTLQAGKAMGLTQGSIFDIYPPQTYDFKKENKLATVEIITLDTFKAKAKITEIFSRNLDNQAIQFRAIESQHAYKLEPIILLIDSKSYEKQQEIEDIISKKLSGYFTIIEEGAANLVISIDTDTLSINRPGRNKTWSLNIEKDQWQEELVEKLEKWGRWFRTRNLENKNLQSLKVTLEIYPIKPRDKQDLNKHIFKHEEKAGIRVVNHSNKDLFIYLLNIFENGNIKLEFPSKPGQNHLLKAGQTWPPAQEEITGEMQLPQDLSETTEEYLLLASENPIDVQFLTIKGIGRAAEDPLSLLLKISGLNHKPFPLTIEQNSWTAQHLEYTITRD